MSNTLIAGAAHAEIQKGIESRHAAYLAADQKFREQTRKHYQILDQLEAKYAEKAFSIACQQGMPPQSANGTYQEPSTVTVEVDGILMTWKSTDSDCRSHKIGWEDLDPPARAAEAEN